MSYCDEYLAGLSDGPFADTDGMENEETTDKNAAAMILDLLEKVRRL